MVMAKSADRPLALVMLPRMLGAATAAERHCEIMLWDELDDRQDFLDRRGGEVRVIVTANTLPLPAPLAAFPALELLAYFGAGHAAPETDLCLARGIAVSNVPATNHRDVADLALGLTIAAVRRLAQADRLVRGGGWNRLQPLPVTPSLGDLRYGIVGLGAIGVAVAERLGPFGGEVLWWGPHAKPDSRWRRTETLLELAQAVDVLIVAVRAGPETRRLIDADILAALGPGGYLINVSRGYVVDEDALVAALRQGLLAGGGLDVFADEPTDPARWRALETMVLSPHIGAAAWGGIAASQEVLAENLRRHFAGEPLLNPVTS
jgi:lactate dehydrogenase-like 2-hydroxyacid dehydrogenase